MSVGGPCSVQGCWRKHAYNSDVCHKHGSEPADPPPTRPEHPVETVVDEDEDLWWTEEDEGETRTKQLMAALATVALLALLIPIGQDMVSERARTPWGEADGTATFDPEDATLSYNYTVGGSEFTGDPLVFPWHNESKQTLEISIVDRAYDGGCSQSRGFSLEPGEIAYAHIQSTGGSKATNATVLITLWGSGTTSFKAVQGTSHALLSMAPGEYTVRVTNPTEWVPMADPLGLLLQPIYVSECRGKHLMTIEIYEAPINHTSTGPTFSNGNVTVQYDTGDPSTSALIAPVYPDHSPNIVMLLLAYLAALVVIFRGKEVADRIPNYNLEEHKLLQTQISGTRASRGWTERQEGGNFRFTCERAGFHEFDTYDGICFHCKKVVDHDTHLQALVLGDRTATRLLDMGRDPHPSVLEKLDEVLEPLIDRDIQLIDPAEGTVESRVRALQEVDDKEYILTEMERHFPDWEANRKRHLEGNLEDGEVSLGLDLDSLGHAIDTHYYRLHDCYPGNPIFLDFLFDPGDWELVDPAPPSPALRGSRGTENLNPVAHIVAATYLIGAWNWMVDQDFTSEGMEHLVAVLFLPVPIIYNFFSYGHEME